MKTHNQEATEVRMVLPKITIAMLICGIVSAAGIGAASAATPDEDVYATTVKFDAHALQSDEGARAVYSQLAKAAVNVCPAAPGDEHLPPASVLECRKAAVARAVMKINNPRLVAVYNSSVKNG
jgi:UrcA family protein